MLLVASCRLLVMRVEAEVRKIARLLIIKVANPESGEFEYPRVKPVVINNIYE